ncbi:Flagellar hook-length control protein FliK [Pannonibacter phragmitetus]|uniref:Flagellar hook-length control protein FliK n=1 Tax=Pannonibacter phragmitetus TaxID=121719 RepID=A0A378ZR04_9HYPH|nr:flagellar hook-length control protein FliK [Pannonibacter phragmitetus]SUA99508.1 Flagellar hook-length control protein FliK [Pannonibacter phragmitetus]
MAMIAATVAAPAAASPAAAGKSGAQEDAGNGFSDLMRKMTPKDGKQEKGGEQTPAPADGTAAGAAAQMQGEPALPDLLAGLFDLPGQQGTEEGPAQPGSAASLMAALVQPAGAAAGQMVPASVTAAQTPAPVAAQGGMTPDLAGAWTQASQSALPQGTAQIQPQPMSQPQAQQAMPSGPVMPTSEELAGLDDAGLISRLIRSDGAAEGEPVDDAGALRVAAGMGKINVTREETHFAPSLRLSPAQQIGTAIASALNTPQQPDTARSDAAAAGFRVRPDAPAVKMLEIQLQPMELGSVKVTMKLTGDTVQVVMTASNPDTAELLKQDRQLLDQLMRATGQRADSITIQAAGDDRPAFQVTGAQPGQGTQGQASGDGRGAMAQGQFGEAMGGSKEGQGGSSGSSARTDNSNDGTEGQQHATAGDGRSGALYL